jgi:23S rRNA pseudouridine1911/1915/1917 synthase
LLSFSVETLLKLASPATCQFWEVPVLFEDEHVLALNKPPGLLTSPSRHEVDQPSLMKLLHTAVAEGRSWARDSGLSYLMNAHRLDCEASGVLLLARSKPVLIALANLFGSEQVLQNYLALVRGAPPQDAFEVDAPLAPHPVKPGVIHIDRAQGKQSKTGFEVVERFNGYTLLRCHLHTARPHQIRVHLRSVRLPVAGDTTYGGKTLLLSRLKSEYRLKPGQTERPLLAMAALHAERLEMTHPMTGQPLAIAAGWPKDFTVALKYLRRYASRPGPDSVNPAGAQS